MPPLLWSSAYSMTVRGTCSAGCSAELKLSSNITESFVLCAGHHAVPEAGWRGRVPVLPVHARVWRRLPHSQQEMGLPQLLRFREVLQVLLQSISKPWQALVHVTLVGSSLPIFLL